MWVICFVIAVVVFMQHVCLSQEEEELIAEWQPEPLVPNNYPNDRDVDPAPVISR